MERTTTLAIILGGFLAAACAAKQPVDDASVYEAEQLRCVDEAATRAQADACRNKVKAAWGRLDGGAE